MRPAPVTQAVPELSPYPLPSDVRQALLSLAAETDVLFLGEMHGTQEVPQIIATLLPDLAAIGYRGLALEVPANVRDALAAWGADAAHPVPAFFTAPSWDGRGNVQALALVQAALRPTASLWSLLCFDDTPEQNCQGWTARDAGMAENLAEQRRTYCPDGRVLAICGNMHSRVVRRSEPEHWTYKLWPPFAVAFREREPGLVVQSVNTVFHSGACYNGGIKALGDTSQEPPAQAYIVQDNNGEHTLDLHLPRATAATFLAAPPPAPEMEGTQL